MRCRTQTVSAIVFVLLFASVAFAQQTKKAPKKPAPFKWVNKLPKNASKSIQHATFHSDANDTEVGYCILLPPGYSQKKNHDQRYPVVYWLHGGRPGSETKNISMVKYIEPAMKDAKIPPMIYVFPNGGKLSHYDHAEFKGEQAFLELINHIDATYRTIADRKGRAIEGFSQGGRGAGRDMFKYPELFCSAAPLGGGHQHEKRISESEGAESNNLTISPPWNNTWDLAKKYAEKKNAPKLRILVAVGTEDFNFEANQEWSKHMKSLGIDHEFVIVPDIPHSSQKMYEKIGDHILNFHVESFRQSGGLSRPI